MPQLHTFHHHPLKQKSKANEGVDDLKLESSSAATRHVSESTTEETILEIANANETVSASQEQRNQHALQLQQQHSLNTLDSGTIAFQHLIQQTVHDPTTRLIDQGRASMTSAMDMHSQSVYYPQPAQSQANVTAASAPAGLFPIIPGPNHPVDLASHSLSNHLPPSSSHFTPAIYGDASQTPSLADTDQTHCDGRGSIAIEQYAMRHLSNSIANGSSTSSINLSSANSVATGRRNCKKKKGTSASAANDVELRRLLREYDEYTLKQMAHEVQKHDGSGGKAEKVKQVFAML
ncbi:hypothetical protein KEM54_003116, partial [Ascosphaera aggregata]